LKRSIAIASKKNFQLEKEVRNLDQKIALLIKNRITLEEVMQQSGDLNLTSSTTTTIKDKRLKQVRLVIAIIFGTVCCSIA